jgi:mRNA interferase RelE/StbE
VPALYGFAYSERALTFLGTLTVKLRKQIINKVKALAAEPFPPGHKMIRGMDAKEERVYRIRSGDYRVLYVVRSNPSHIAVLDIDHRKDIYR